MITVAELKALEWKFAAHADGSDRGGRFSINFHNCTVPDGRVVQGFRKQWRSGAQAAGYAVEGQTFDTLAQVAAYLSQPTAGDPDGVAE